MLSVIGATWPLFLSFRSQTPGFSFARARIPTGPSFSSRQSFYVEGSSSPVTGRDEEGSNYHSRKLADGTSYRVQNFPSADDLMKTVHGIVKIRDQQSDYYWVFQDEPVASA
jgi:hypothetical protein